MHSTLRRGQALIIKGPQSSGRTAIAQQIAQRYGSFSRISVEMFETDSVRNCVLEAQPTTLIVGEFPSSQKSRNVVLELVRNDHVIIRPPHNRALVKVKTPHLIFCTGQVDFWLDKDDRRFHVIDLHAQAKQHSAGSRMFARLHKFFTRSAA